MEHSSCYKYKHFISPKTKATVHIRVCIHSFFLSESVLIQADFWFFMYELTCIRVGLCTTYALYSKYQCSRYRISTVLCCAMTHFVKFHVLVHLTHFVN